MAEGVTSRSACLSWAGPVPGAVVWGQETERETERQWREKPCPETEHWGQVKNQTDGDEESEVRVDPQATHICRPACWPGSQCLEHRAPSLILCLFPGLATA